MLLSVIVATTIAASLGAYYYYKNTYSYWSQRNISGPRPYYVLGHFLHLLYNHKTDFIKKAVKEHGRVFGIYEGTDPVLMIADPELARRICVKDFDAWPNHKVNHLLNDIQRDFIFFQQDDHWRRVRALMSPTFTSGKMRKMVNLMGPCADDLMTSIGERIDDCVQKDLNKPATINMKDVFSLYAMDAITTCCYALKLERSKEATDIDKMASRNRFVADALKLFQFNYVRLFTAFIFNSRLLAWLGFEITAKKTLMPMMEKTTKLIEKRRGDKRHFDDYLQMLLDAKLDDRMELDDFDLKENHHASLTNESLQIDQKKLISLSGRSGPNNGGLMNDREIASSAMFLMVVGLETTANLLTNASIALAYHDEAQTKLREEVRKLVRDNGNDSSALNYDSITSCQYLDAVLSETLRMLSPIMIVDRVCNQDYLLDEYNLTLPKGSKVSIHLNSIMNNAEFWPEPEKFRPERFMPENREKIVPGSYLPFGIGPRHCLGMRFSLTESKLALARAILKFKFEPAPGARFPPESKPNLGFLQLKNPAVNVSPI